MCVGRGGCGAGGGKDYLSNRPSPTGIRQSVAWGWMPGGVRGVGTATSNTPSPNRHRSVGKEGRGEDEVEVEWMAAEGG